MMVEPELLRMLRFTVWQTQMVPQVHCISVTAVVTGQEGH